VDLSAATLWWILAGVLVVAELLTSTFYLLMLAVGAVAAALAAHLGLGSAAQLLAAAVVGGGATVAWHLRRRKHPTAAPAESNRDVNLDVGEQVQVDAWAPDGSTSVRYRGAQWKAQRSPGAAVATGPHRVAAVQGNRLVLQPSDPA
jgi:membrane protein implicated in regulation of membrane protease activity